VSGPDENVEIQQWRTTMALEDLTMALFTACNVIRVVAYVPQIYRAATDKNGASAISYTTWTLFLIAHASTVVYALVNRADWNLAACFAVNAVCCIAILAVAHLNRRGYLNQGVAKSALSATASG
jgi:uncharacterized protein with PQ loop repeat